MRYSKAYRHPRRSQQICNQEVACLLQGIESYNGLVNLASNERANVDDAFDRPPAEHHPVPDPAARVTLRNLAETFPPQIAVADHIDWRQIAARHELTGAGILNITHFCAVDALARQSLPLDLKPLEAAIQREHVEGGQIV